MSEPTKKDETEQEQLTKQELEDVAGGIIVQGGFVASLATFQQAPTVTAPKLPTSGDMLL